MRISKRTPLAAAALAAVLVCVAGAALVPTTEPAQAADEDDDADPTGERARAAADALAKAVSRGRQLWVSKDLGKKSCASCHEDPEKPDIDLRTRTWSYPAYSRRKRAVVTLQQKINEMMVYNSRGKAFDADSTDVAALAAYVQSLCKR